MKFSALIEHHKYVLELELHSGVIHKGVITSHSFKDSTMEFVSEISVMSDYSIEKIDCKDIKTIRRIELNNLYRNS